MYFCENKLLFTMQFKCDCVTFLIETKMSIRKGILRLKAILLSFIS